MAYWVIQALWGLAIFFFGYQNSDSYKEIYGNAVTAGFYLVNALSFIIFTHFILRLSSNYLRRKEKSALTILVLALPLIVLCSLSNFIVESLAANILLSDKKAQIYYNANPERSPKQMLNKVNEKLALIEQGRSHEIKEVKNKLAEFENQALSSEELKIKKKAFEKGLKVGLEQRQLTLEAKIGNNEAQKAKTITRISLTFILYMFWFIGYFPLSALTRRFQVKNQLKQSQIALLMSQLNPHFLFNSLNSIRGMIFEDKQLAKELIDKLNELFRYNLTANKHPTVKLKEELRICEFYLDIEHIRLEERLLIEMHVDETCLNIKVPTMGILTLIENSIKHGIAPRQEQSLLIVDIAKHKNQLVVSVSNPIYTGNYKVESTGTGQENLIKRLQLMYNENASLNAALKDDKYVACLTLPL